MIDLGTNLNSSKEFCEKYYKILSEDYPHFLDDYINTPAMQNIAKSSISCGCNYTKMFNLKFLYSNLDHSIAVALVIWHFTKDKKATLAGLFHDIATPSFKHCIDFMHNDHLKQESTEEKTYEILKNDDEIQRLLKRDGIKTYEVDDYKIYPIADNDMPKLSADRLEYTLSNGIFLYEAWNIDEISRIYNDLIIVKDENNEDELCFNSLKIADFFVIQASKIWPKWINANDKISMQFIADTCRYMIEHNYFSEDDLYTLSEIEIIDMILNCSDKKIANNFSKYMNSFEAHESDKFIKNNYCRSINPKKRYINPLVMTDDGPKRISEVSKAANECINELLKYETKKYVYLDIEEIFEVNV